MRICSDRRPATAGIWNPGQRRKKALFDIAQELTGGASAWDSDPELIKLSVPYLLLLTYVSASGRYALSRSRQFALVSTSRRSEPTVLFVSGLHDLEDDVSLTPNKCGGSRVMGSGGLYHTDAAYVVSPGNPFPESDGVPGEIGCWKPPAGSDSRLIGVEGLIHERKGSPHLGGAETDYA